MMLAILLIIRASILLAEYNQVNPNKGDKNGLFTQYDWSTFLPCHS